MRTYPQKGLSAPILQLVRESCNHLRRRSSGLWRTPASGHRAQKRATYTLVDVMDLDVDLAVEFLPIKRNERVLPVITSSQRFMAAAVTVVRGVITMFA